MEITEEMSDGRRAAAFDVRLYSQLLKHGGMALDLSSMLLAYLIGFY
jgi:hypothetical protein